MNEENVFLFLISALTFILIIKSAKYNKKFSLFNLTVFFIYSLYLYNGLFYRGEEGMSLGWLIFIIFFTGVHLFFIVGYLLIKGYSKKNKPIHNK